MFHSETIPEYTCAYDASWHEVGCPHKRWEPDELIEALDTIKVRLQIVENKIMVYERPNIRKEKTA